MAPNDARPGVQAGLADEVVRIAVKARRDKARQVADYVLRRTSVHHVTVAAVDRSTGEGRVLAITGTDVVRAGVVAFAQQSTRLEAVVAGRVWSSSDFASEPNFDRLLDRIATLVGHRSGCAVPIAAQGRTVGAILLSSCDHRTSWNAIADDITCAAPALATALGLGPLPVLRVLVLHQDMLTGEGLARVLEHGLHAEVRLADGLRPPPPRGSFAWADVVVADPESGAINGGSVVIPPGWSKGQILAAVAMAATKPTPTRPTRAVPALTPRELDLLRELDSGMTYHAIGRQLGLTTETVRTYSKTLYTKLDAHSRGEAVFRARRQGLL